MLRLTLCLALLTAGALAQTPTPTPDKEAREYLPEPYAAYFRQQVEQISKVDWQAGLTKETWPAKQAEMREQLREMLGLNPWPERGELKPVITGTIEGDGYLVEKLHFQSSPGLYVTANLYRPKEVTQPLPTILYLCGHSSQMENGISYGNKAGYQHHGAWFARHGYVCLIIDSVQLGEIRGEHWGTFRLGRWWWMSRGYTPAGVEAWNGLRALDYLETRAEVDKTRFGVTGRSGGGIYSWWVAALDDRIKVAAPTAGITTLKDYVLDGSIEGHCDCMFMVNKYRWDYDRVAALVAPRPLLISNTDKDPLFSLEGVTEIYHKTRRLYRTLGAESALGLQVAEGPHSDFQTLNIGAFAWMERHLKGAKATDFIDEPAKKYHQPKELRVFTELPKDERNTKVDEWFVPAAPTPALPTKETWADTKAKWIKALEHVEPVSKFPAVPRARVPRGPRANLGAKESSFGVTVELTDKALSPASLGISARREDQLRRRFYLLGGTFERYLAQEYLSALWITPNTAFEARGTSAVSLLLAARMEAESRPLRVLELPLSLQQTSGAFLMLAKHLDIPQLLVLAAEKNTITVVTDNPSAFAYARQAADALGFGQNLVFEAPVQR